MGGKWIVWCQADVGKVYRALGCLYQGINSKSKEVGLTTAQEFIDASSGIYCTVLVTASEEEHSCYRECSAWGNYFDSGARSTKL